jgi:Predicted flavin-nucleotide-binding protein
MITNVRLKARECHDLERIHRFLKEARTAYMGLSDGGAPYVVPLNYVWHNGAFYAHGAAEGRKMDILSRNANACFTVSEDYGTLPHPVPAKTDTAYMSVMGFGKVELVADLDEATEVLQQMLHKYAPGFHGQPLAKSHVERYRSSLGSATAVLKLKPEYVTAKENGGI